MRELDEEEKEEQQYLETVQALERVSQQFISLFGKKPTGTLSETQEAITRELRRRGTRPYKL